MFANKMLPFKILSLSNWKMDITSDFGRMHRLTLSLFTSFLLDCMIERSKGKPQITHFSVGDHLLKGLI